MTNDSQQGETGNPDDELSLQEAIDQIADALQRSKSPLFVGLENLSTQSQRAAMKLAHLAKATADSSSDNVGRGNIFALQKRGRVTATLGEIHSRSNLVVFWFCDPLSDHPDFFDRFINENCRTVAIDSSPNPTSETADQFISLHPEQAAGALWLMRAIVAGIKPDSDLNLPTEIQQLAEQLPNSQYGAMLWGSEHQEAEFDLQAEGIHALIRELNQHTRFVGIPYRRDANGLSAENVSTWISGFPFAVNWNRNKPRQYWLEYSDLNVSERDEWDFLISFEIGEVNIACQPSDSQPAFQMALPVAALGVEESGSACRFDDVSITLDATDTATSPTTEEIIRAIHDAMLAMAD